MLEPKSIDDETIPLSNNDFIAENNNDSIYEDTQEVTLIEK